MTQLGDDKRTLETQMFEYETKCSDLQETVARVERERDEVKSGLLHEKSALEAELSDLKLRKDKCEEQIAGLTEDSKVKASTIRGLETKETDLIQQLKKAEQVKLQLQKEIKQLTESKSALQVHFVNSTALNRRLLEEGSTVKALKLETKLHTAGEVNKRSEDSEDKQIDIDLQEHDLSENESTNPGSDGETGSTKGVGQQCSEQIRCRERFR